jgi:hypothetical protein
MTSGDFRRATHAGLSLQEMADRLEIRELVDAYAFRTDSRVLRLRYAGIPGRGT